MAKKIMTLEDRGEVIQSVMGKGVDEIKDIIYKNYTRCIELEEVCKEYPVRSKEHKSYYTLYKFYIERGEILEKELESAYFVAYAK